MAQQTIKLQVPEGVEFDALRLSRDTATGDLSFDWQPIEAICAASGLDVAVLREDEEGNVADLILTWYVAHRNRGGAENAVMEQLLTEAMLEEQVGHHRVQRGSDKLQ